MIKIQVLFLPTGYQIGAEGDTPEECATAILHMRTRIENPLGAKLRGLKGSAAELVAEPLSVLPDGEEK